MASTGVWLEGPAGSVCAAQLTVPVRASGRAVLMLPPVGYEYSSSHRFCRTVAERLAEDGATVLRLDYWATGDSSGVAAELTDLSAWQESVTRAAAWLRQRGATEVVVVGVQLGALLGLSVRELIGASALVSVAPTLSGRRFGRGLAVMGLRGPGDDAGIAVGGTHFPAPLLAALAATTVQEPSDIACLTIASNPAVAAFLQQPAEEAVVDPELVEQIASWVQALPVASDPATIPDLSDQAPHGDSTGMVHDGVSITERFVTVGSLRLRGVLTTPRDDSASGAVFVLLSSGSDPHVGPGRAWVELARYLATTGLSTLRVDFRGWGESPDGPSVPGRPYDSHTVEDVCDIVAALTGEGRRVVLGGLCAGAHAALTAARTIGLTGVVVLNPQLYWQPGDPIEALMSATRTRRAVEIEQIRAGAASGRWDEQDEQGLRPPAAEWLDDLVGRGRPVSMIFAEGDDGIEYLRERLGRRLAAAVGSGVVTVEEVPDIDHGMHRTWLRPVIFARIRAHLERVLATGPSLS